MPFMLEVGGIEFRVATILSPAPDKYSFPIVEIGNPLTWFKVKKKDKGLFESRVSSSLENFFDQMLYTSSISHAKREQGIQKPAFTDEIDMRYGYFGQLLGFPADIILRLNRLSDYPAQGINNYSISMEIKILTYDKSIEKKIAERFFIAYNKIIKESVQSQSSKKYL